MAPVQHLRPEMTDQRVVELHERSCSLSAISQQVGVSRLTVCRWLRIGRRPRAPHTRAICNDLAPHGA